MCENQADPVLRPVTLVSLKNLGESAKHAHMVPNWAGGGGHITFCNLFGGSGARGSVTRKIREMQEKCCACGCYFWVGVNEFGWGVGVEAGDLRPLIPASAGRTVSPTAAVLENWSPGLSCQRGLRENILGCPSCF